MVSRTHRCIFVHIPKCAGNSVQKVIWPGKWTEEDLWGGFIDQYHNKYQTGGLQHLLARQIREEVGRKRFDSYFKFTIVRNPFDRTVSQFAYMKRRPDLRQFVGMREDASFAEYVDLIQRRTHVQWEPQYSFILDDEGGTIVDFVGRFELIDRDMQVVFDRIGLGGRELPVGNRSDRGPYRDYYTDETREQVGAMYRTDLEQFEYEF
jgi:hypothetical protein